VAGRAFQRADLNLQLLATGLCSTLTGWIRLVRSPLPGDTSSESGEHIWAENRIVIAKGLGSQGSLLRG
jgi:hypothetical protein